VENQIRPWALGRSNWLFAGSLRSGQRAAAVMTLIQSAKLNGHDPYAYLKDVLTKLPTQKNNAIDELLPHHWTPAIISNDVMGGRLQTAKLTKLILMIRNEVVKALSFE
jgi:transposase